MGYFEGGEIFQGMRSSQGWGEVVIAHQQQGRDAGTRQAHDAPAPFTLKGGRRCAIFVGIAGEDHQVDFFFDGSIYNRIQRFEKVHDARRQSSLRIMTPVVRHINMCIGKMQEFNHGSIPNCCNSCMQGEKPGCTSRHWRRSSTALSS